MINVNGTILIPGGCLPLPWGYIHVYFHKIEASSPLKLLGQSNPNFIWSIFEMAKKVYINGHGHMTKMAAMSVNRKIFKNLFLQNQEAYDLEIWCEASVNGAFQRLYK